MTPSHGTADPANHRLRYRFGSRDIMQEELFHRPLAQADGTKCSGRRPPREMRGGLRIITNPPALFRCRWYDGEQSVHRDGTKHPVIKIDHVVKHDVVITKQIVGVQTKDALIQGCLYREHTT